MTSGEQLYIELGALRKGAGVRHPRVRDRLGPELSALCAIEKSTTHSAARDRIVEMLTRAVGALPDEPALAARVMLAIDVDHDAPTLTERQRRLATTWHVDHMTVRRRCDDAIRRLSDVLADRAADFLGVEPPEEELFQSGQWYVRASTTTLRLDGPSPEAHEVRTIVSLRDGLRGVTLGMGTPRARAEERPRLGLDVELLYGGELVRVDQVAAAYFVYRVQFPEPLSRGDERTIEVRVRIPEGQVMVPRYVSRSAHRVDLLELRIKFDRERTPRAVWRINALPFPVSEEDGPNGDDVAVDSVGEAFVRFTNLRPRFAYGLCWLF